MTITLSRAEDAPDGVRVRRPHPAWEVSKTLQVYNAQQAVWLKFTAGDGLDITDLANVRPVREGRVQ